ncbi:MAG: FAD-binding protein, partial [Planctomycetota bacterium]
MTTVNQPLTVEIDHLEVPLAQLRELGPIGLDHRLQPWIAKLCCIPATDIIDYELERRSLDARKKPDLRYVYNLRARVKDGSPVVENPHIRVLTAPPAQDDQLWHLSLRPDVPKDVIVVGTGPAGLMCAYLLAVHGCKVAILDRGRDVERRGADLERMHATRTLDPDSNYLFGEGGAGTYSDGKLYTRVKDRRMRFLLEAFVTARAPRHILWRHHPHIGSDLLPHMCKRLRQAIEARGGSFHWDSEVVDLLLQDGRCAGVELKDGRRLNAQATVIAPGHSARRLILAIAKRGAAHKSKGFQIGCRIEH